jgi:hypothetical protein
MAGGRVGTRKHTRDNKNTSLRRAA